MYLDNNYSIILDRAFYNSYKINYKYEHIYVDYDDTLIVNNKVNTTLMALLYQATEKNIKIHLLSKHTENLIENLKERRIGENLFDEIIVLNKDMEKKDYIQEFPAIFIDDSFAERKRVKEYCGIPVFDVDMIESLIDWRV